MLYSCTYRDAVGVKGLSELYLAIRPANRLQLQLFRNRVRQILAAWRQTLKPEPTTSLHRTKCRTSADIEVTTDHRYWSLTVLYSLRHAVTVLPSDCDDHGTQWDTLASFGRVFTGGIATASRLSVRPSVCDVEVSWSDRLKVFKKNFTISELECSLFATPTSRIYSKGNTAHPKIFAEIGVGCEKEWLLVHHSSNISETRQDWTKVTIEDQQKVICALSIGAKINDVGWPWKVIMHS